MVDIDARVVRNGQGVQVTFSKIHSMKESEEGYSTPEGS